MLFRVQMQISTEEFAKYAITVSTKGAFVLFLY